VVQLRLGHRTYTVPVAWDWMHAALDPDRH